jgi:hypothetical protein
VALSDSSPTLETPVSPGVTPAPGAAAGKVASTRDPLAALRDPGTVRARCRAITRAVEQGLSGHFRLDRSRLDDAAQRVARLTRERFPDLKIPYHSRWRHFEAGGVDRKGELDTLLAGRNPAEVARARIDLTVVSVLLDAGAGPQWRYTERAQIDTLALPVHRQHGDDLLAMLGQAAGAKAAAEAAAASAPGTPADMGTGGETIATPGEEAGAPPAAEAEPARSYTRSEGLGVASFRAFVAGVFSATPGDPLRVDALALERLDAAALRAVFQVSPSNPLVGLEGRAALLAALGGVLRAQAQAQGGEPRPGRLWDRLVGSHGGPGATLDAGALLRTLARDYAPIWRSGSHVLGLPAGDVWPHRWAGAETGDGRRDGVTPGWVPFHKLSQWLTYSLLEPFEWSGARVSGLDALTGLPEYRNGGLLLDCGVIVPRAERDLARTWKPADEFVVEWRALTVTLLDELAERVRALLGVTAQQLPLACVLEGGTWAAGRQIAQALRGGLPPVTIDSDGTVF